ncbi:hypothetical protein A4A49_19383 [Nicotiana attenuata]|uniref:Uncharacterized protein n=1 Tax=Nicotiana attenuata TaxID=49451 RepID=A0A314KRT2_NICAT|nr:hypothetical protein A4A49_19383 [Nicotiana attenuata]
MATAPTSTSGKPPDQMQKERLSKAHTNVQESVQTSIPIATNLQKGIEVTVAKNCLGTLKNSYGDSGSKNGIPIHGELSLSQNESPHQKLANSTVGINISAQFNNSGETEVAGYGGPTGQTDNSGYQQGRKEEDNSLAPSILYGYRSTASILQALHPVHSLPSDGRQNAPHFSGAIDLQQPIANAPTHPKEQVRNISNQSNMGIDQCSQKINSETHQLAGNGVPVVQKIQDQCQTTPMIQENVPKSSSQLLNEPNLSHIGNGNSADVAPKGARPNASADATAAVAKVSTQESLQPLGSQLKTSDAPGPSVPAQTRHQSQRDLEIKRKKEEGNDATTATSPNIQQKFIEKGESSKQQQNNNQQGKPKKGASDHNEKAKTKEHQKSIQQQDAIEEIPEEEWQTQKRKNFKGNNQTKRQQQVYMQKQPNTQQPQLKPKEIQQNDTPPSGMPSINPPAQLERSDGSPAQNPPYPNVPPSVVDSGAQSPTIPHVPHINSGEVEGGMVKCQEKDIGRQEGVPDGN